MYQPHHWLLVLNEKDIFHSKTEIHHHFVYFSYFFLCFSNSFKPCSHWVFSLLIKEAPSWKHKKKKSSVKKS